MITNAHVDTHAHLQLKAFTKDCGAVLERASEKGLRAVITIGINLESSRRGIEISCTKPLVLATAGFHPHNAKEMKKDDLPRLEQLALNEKVVALGEMGLDFHYNFSPPDVQREVLRQQVRLAHRLKKPLVIHSREAGKEVLAILEEEGAGELGGVVHCFSDGTAEAERYLAMGFYLGFTGIVTYRASQELRRIVEEIPQERILAETDCPYLTPEPLRGKRNEPSYIPLIVETIARLRQKPVPEMTAILWENACRLFPGLRAAESS